MLEVKLKALAAEFKQFQRQNARQIEEAEAYFAGTLLARVLRWLRLI